MIMKNLAPFFSPLALLTALAFLFSSPLLLAQDCGDSSSDAADELPGIGEVTVKGAGDEREATRAYKQALADKAEEQGLASCDGDCTIGDCEIQFDSYADGSGTPDATTNDNGDCVFDAPGNNDLSFSVHCPCVVQAHVSPPQEYDGRVAGGQRPEVLPSSSWRGLEAVEFFPNPARETVQVTVDLREVSTDLTLSVIDLRGRVQTVREIGQVERGQYRFALDVASLAPGLYLGLVHHEGEIVAQSRIAIQR